MAVNRTGEDSFSLRKTWRRRLVFREWLVVLKYAQRLMENRKSAAFMTRHAWPRRRKWAEHKAELDAGEIWIWIRRLPADENEQATEE